MNEVGFLIVERYYMETECNIYQEDARGAYICLERHRKEINEGKPPFPGIAFWQEEARQASMKAQILLTKLLED